MPPSPGEPGGQDPSAHRKMADPAKTAKKSTTLPPRIVPKTFRYPMAENQAQSTRKSLVRPSTMITWPIRVALGTVW